MALARLSTFIAPQQPIRMNAAMDQRPARSKLCCIRHESSVGYG